MIKALTTPSKALEPVENISWVKLMRLFGRPDTLKLRFKSLQPAGGEVNVDALTAGVTRGGGDGEGAGMSEGVQDTPPTRPSDLLSEPDPLWPLVEEYPG